jgi:alpha-glucosidase
MTNPMSAANSNSDYLWWRDGVIYQIYPRSFMDSNGDGVGDIPGITSRLDYIASLGVDAIWLSPINTSPMKDFGYDISDYDDIDPIFGNRADFAKLTAEAHKRGLKVMMDLVINHSSDEHAWFKESRSSRDNEKASWYIWQDPKPGKKPPNNWTSAFGGGGWEWDETRQQFYYHMFLKEQPDLNWRNPDLRAAVMNSIKSWLDMGVDGFRLDVVNAYFKDAELRDNPPQISLDPKAAMAWFRQKHVYDRDQPELLDVYKEFRDMLDAYPERTSVGEVMAEDPHTPAKYIGEGKLHMAFNFGFMFQPWLPRTFQQSAQAWEAAMPPDGWPCYVLSNHDNPRHVSRHGGGPFADARAKVAAAMLLTLRGTPFMYYGEELAMPSPSIPRHLLVDPPSKKYWPFYQSRDSARTPMQWDETPNAGFTTGHPWLPVGPTYTTCNVSTQNDDPDSVLNFYRSLLRLRKSSVALRRGTFKPLEQRPVAALTYLREGGGQTMFVALNFFAHEVEVPMPSGMWAPRLSTHNNSRMPTKTLKLEPFEASIFEQSDYL